MPALVESMFSAREVPWHQIGTVTDDVLTAAEAIEAAGLDWEVDLRPMYVLSSQGDKVRVPDKFGVVRDADESVLGVVGKNYVPFQNREAFQFFDNLVDSGEAMYETAGSLKHGRWVWLTAKLPNHIQIGGIDEVEVYLLLHTSHDGTKSIQVDVTPVRVVCANTLNLATRASKRKWSVRHLATAGHRLQEARNTLGMTFKYIDTFTAEAELLLSQSFTDRQMKNLLDTILPDLPRKESTKELILDNFVEGKTLDNIRGTKWGALNAIGEYYDWLRDPRTPQSQVLGSWQGVGVTQRNKALALLRN